MQQLLHICSEHFDSKEKEEDKDKKEKKEKDKKEAPADMGAHQVPWVAGHSGLLRKDKMSESRRAGFGFVLGPLWVLLGIEIARDRVLYMRDKAAPQRTAFLLRRDSSQG